MLWRGAKAKACEEPMSEQRLEGGKTQQVSRQLTAERPSLRGLLYREPGSVRAEMRVRAEPEQAVQGRQRTRNGQDHRLSEPGDWVIKGVETAGVAGSQVVGSSGLTRDGSRSGELESSGMPFIRE